MPDPIPDARPVRLSGALTCASATDVAIVAQYLPDHIRLSRAEPGCLSFNVVQTTDPAVWQVDEAFTDRAAFEAHQTRTRASAWFRATGHIPRAFTVSEG